MGAQIDIGSELVATAPGMSTLSVRGMTCSGCARHVADAIQSVPGVQDAVVDLDSGKVRVRWHADVLRDEDALLRAVRAAGYEPGIASGQKTQLAISGMTCSGCARKAGD